MTNKDEIMVSIICNVFNHEKYIADTIQAFVEQIVDFPIEVLVHDDCSTDNSAKIIKGFEEKYPDIIKPIYQTENQYTKHIGISRNYQLPRARGKYLAHCEGDDLWIDKYKLAKQIAYMEAHPDCTFCFTNARIVNVQNGKTRKYLPYNKDDKKVINNTGVYDVLQLAQFAFLPACSFVERRSNYSHFPEYYYEKCFGGDRKISLFSTALGYAYFLDEETCCYHYGVANSIMTKKKSKHELALTEYSFIRLNNNLNRFTEYKHNDYFTRDNMRFFKIIYALNGGKNVLSDEEIKLVRASLTLTDRIKRIIYALSPNWFVNYVRALKRRFFV